jgi:hypothetical protein
VSHRSRKFSHFGLICDIIITYDVVSRSAASARLKDLATFTALVDCLCNLLEEHAEETGTTVPPTLPKTRPPGEKKALSTLNILLGENIPAALEAGVVSRWLSRYPFSVPVEPELRRRLWNDNQVLNSIGATLSSHQEGIKQLQKYGLVGSVMEENDHDEYDGDSDVWMIDGDDTAGPRRSSGRRVRDDNAEEQALRRRRREAMVFSEGGRPLGSDNIIQPVPE